MARQTYYTDVVSQCLTAKLGTQANLVGFLKQLLLQINVTECTTRLVAGGGQRVVVLDAGKLYGQQVLLG